MNSINKNCQRCTQRFEITSDDLKFYEKISPTFERKKFLIPPPTLCPDCRQQRRLAFRNERKLYHRKSDFSGKEFISIYSPEKPYKVFDTQEWWSDEWDGIDYGQPFDFSKTFFEQFGNLWRKVPMLGLNVVGNEDCGYVSYCGYSKRCYLSYNTDFSEDVYYSANSIRCKTNADLLNNIGCELGYENTDSYNCYNVQFSFFSFQCTDSKFLIDCRNCQNCFGCVGLRNKKFCIFNKQYSEQEYREKIKKFDTRSRQEIERTKKELEKLYVSVPKPAILSNNSENVSGNYIFNSKNITQSYDIQKSENLKFCSMLNTADNCYDWDYTGYNSSFCYELSSCGDRIYNSSFSHNIWTGGTNLLYCVLGSQLQDCFGCIGLKRKKYCVLNKQYPKEEYERLVPKIIEHMIKTKEWGEFFPGNLSPFGYNETLVQDHFPLKKEQALNLKFQWKDEDNGNQYHGPKTNIPDNIDDTTENICKEILNCEMCGKNFKLITQEFYFYKKMQLPIPDKCPECRHRNRLLQRNPYKLWERECMKCKKNIETSYAPERPEIVYCEQCYLKEIY